MIHPYVICVLDKLFVYDTFAATFLLEHFAICCKPVVTLCEMGTAEVVVGAGRLVPLKANLDLSFKQ